MKTKQSLEKLLSDYQPHPGTSFYRRMKAAPWDHKENVNMNRSTSLARFGWQLAAGSLILIALLTFSIPSARAALSAWMGLSVAPANKIPAPAVTLVSVTSTVPTMTAPAVGAPTQTNAVPTETMTSTQEVMVSKPAEISQLSAQIAWEILYPAQLPEGYRLESTYYDTNHQMVILTFLTTRRLPGSTDPSLTASKTITLLQAQKNDFIPMQIAPDTNVEDTKVNDLPAVFAVGAWDTEFVKDDTDPNGGKMVSTWRNDLPVQNLFWQNGTVFLVLVTDDEVVNKQEMTAMATSME